MTSVFIPLLPHEIDFSDNLGQMRQDNAVKNDRRAKNGAPEDEATALAMHILGARCEQAVHIFLERKLVWHMYASKELSEWKNGRRVKLPDIGDDIDVKGVPKAWHRMIVKHDESDDWRFVHVIAESHPVYEIAGWMYGREAKAVPIDDPKGGRPAHFVKRELLHSPLTLRA